ncbi:hypothetical protein B7494_g2430 [Chlorociboria aeruginascens]|nr:hypothetical protein B7494_g2430 [Chlorociboria aeruginascens]
MTTVTTHPPETDFGVVTSWLPLSTVFPLAPGCSSKVFARLGIQIPGDLPVVFDPNIGLISSDWASCQPTQLTSWWLTPTDVTTGVKTLYSIGPLVCPEAYTTAGTSVIASGMSSAYTFARLFAAGIIGQCTSDLTSGAIITYVQELTSGNLYGGLQSLSTTLDADFSMIGVPINGMFFEAAVTATTTSASSTSSSLTSASLTAASLISTNTISSLSSTLPTVVSATTTVVISSTNELSTSAKAGIGVGVTLGGIAILALIAFLFTSSRRKAQKESVQGNGRSAQERGIAHMGAQLQKERAYELGESPQELDSYSNSGTTPHELYAPHRKRLTNYPSPAPFTEVE